LVVRLEKENQLLRSLPIKQKYFLWIVVGEVSKRSSSMAAFLLALPIVSIAAFVWIYVESRDKRG